MSFSKRLFGQRPLMRLWKWVFADASKMAQSRDATERQKEPEPRRQPPRVAQSREDTCGFFVFDYNEMDSYYGKQVFDAIYAALRSSVGVCAFHDGDIFNVETVRKIGRLSNLVKTSSSESPLANLDGAFDFGPYFAAMWTDTYDNFKTLHDSLVAASVPGYLGYMTLPGRLEGQEVIHLFTQQLRLPASIALRDGSLIKGTSKYGIGFRSVDGALLHAAELGNVEAARKAIADGADVDCVDPNDRFATPILYASAQGDVEIVKMLLENGSDANARNAGSNTALMLAARSGHNEVVQMLIAGGADVNATDRSGGTALDNASDHPDIQAILRNSGAKEEPIERRGTKAGGQITALSDLNLQLLLAAKDGDARRVAELLAAGVSPNLREESSGRTPLLLAAYRCDVAIVKLLLEYGAEADATGPHATPLHVAAYLGSEVIVRELLNAGADPESRNDTGHTPLHDAAGEGHAKIVHLLLDAGADIDVTSTHLKETPLHRASYHGRQEVTELLVHRGAFLHPKTLDGMTPLLFAAIQEHLSIVRLLLDFRRGSRVIETPNETTTLIAAEARELCRRAADLRLQWQDEKNLAEAEILFRKAVQQFPEHWEGHFGLGQLLHLKANHAQSKSRDLVHEMIHELRRAAELALHRVEPTLMFARVIAELDVTSAEPLYRSAMDAAFPDGPTLYPERWQAEDHWAIAIHAASKSGQESLCLEAFCRAIDFDPHYYGGFVMPASERAQAIWSLALLVKPGHKLEASESHLDPMLEEAYRAYRASFDEMMKSHNQSVHLAERYQKTGLLSDLEEAMELARKAAQLAPENPKVLGNLGNVLYLLYQHRGRPDDLSSSISALRDSGCSLGERERAPVQSE